MSTILVVLLLANAYLLALYFISRSGRLGASFQLVGPLLMWKTQLGQRTIERVSKWRRTWLLFGDVGIVMTWVMGLLVFALLIKSLFDYIVRPVESAAAAPEPLLLLGIPGVNPLIPVWYGILGLIVALVVHEGCHGILSRAQDIKVKSLGLLFFIIPVGAFVEPDERDLEKASARARNRVYAAGPMSNLVLAVVTALLLSAVLGGASVANDGRGVGITTAVEGLPAAKAGLAPGDILVALDGQPVHTLRAFNTFMNQTRPGEQVQITYLRDGQRHTTTATLIDKYDYAQAQRFQNVPSEWKWKGFLGVNTIPLKPEEGVAPFFTPQGLLGYLANPFSGGFISFIVYISYPFFLLRGVDITQSPYLDFLVLEGPAAAMGTTAFVVTINTLYWIFWLNLMLGTFNALPAGPLDGGQMFRTTLRDGLMRYFRVDRSRIVVEQDALTPGLQTRGADAETQEKLNRINGIVRGATWTLGLFILALILLPVIGPKLVQLVLAP